MMEDLPETVVLVEEEAQVDHREPDREVDHLRYREHRARNAQQHAGAERQQGDARQSLTAAHSEKPLVAAVVLDGDGNLRARKCAAVDLDVPVVPAAVDVDQIFAWQQEIHQALDEAFLLNRLIAPVDEAELRGEPALRLLTRLGEAHGLDVGEAAKSPFVPLVGAQKRAEIDQRREQRPASPVRVAGVEPPAPRERRGGRPRDRQGNKRGHDVAPRYDRAEAEKHRHDRPFERER